MAPGFCRRFGKTSLSLGETRLEVGGRCPESDAVSASYRWYVIGLLTAIAALNYADRAVMAALLPLMRTGLGMSDVMLGTLGAVFLWSYAIGSPTTGWLSDRLPRVRIVVWSLAVWSAATVLSGCAASAGQILATRVLLG